MKWISVSIGPKVSFLFVLAMCLAQMSVREKQMLSPLSKIYHKNGRQSTEGNNFYI